MKRIFAVLVCISVVLLTLVACETNEESSPIEIIAGVTEYDIAVSISEDLEDIAVSTDILYNNNTDDTLYNIGVYVYPLAYMKVTEEKAYLYTLDKYCEIENIVVSVNGDDASYEIDTSCAYLDINLAGGVMPDAEITVGISYDISVPHCDLRFGLYDGTLSLGNFYPVVAVYEDGAFRKDEYSRVGDPFYSEVSDFNVTVSAPESLILATSGEIISEQIAAETCTKTYTIVGEDLRDFAMSANYNYKISEGSSGSTKVLVYTVEDDGSDILATAQSALDVFGEVIGTYPYATYSVVETAFYYGGMEYGSFVIISDDITNRDEVIIHETAHQWFQSIVGSDQVNTPWLDEGLVSYLQDYYYLAIGDTETYTALRTESLQYYDTYLTLQRSTNATWSANMNRTIYQYSTNLEYGLIVYTKGSLMFDAIMEICGQSKFEKALSIYFSENMYGIATTESLIAAFKSANIDIQSLITAYTDDTIMTYVSGNLLYI